MQQEETAIIDAVIKDILYHCLVQIYPYRHKTLYSFKTKPQLNPLGIKRRSRGYYGTNRLLCSINNNYTR